MEWYVGLGGDKNRTVDEKHGQRRRSVDTSVPTEGHNVTAGRKKRKREVGRRYGITDG